MDEGGVSSQWFVKTDRGDFVRNHKLDLLMVPTAPTHPKHTDIDADPLGANARLGTYTNFVNLLDLCGLALPAAMRPDGIPFGITLLAPAGQARTAVQFTDFEVGQ